MTARACVPLPRLSTVQDLFWAIRGGGGGVAGVVTEFTARTHAPPRWLVIGSASVSTNNVSALPALMEQVMTVET